eukprot:8980205-Pyramimonas_sp.AAC.1
MDACRELSQTSCRLRRGAAGIVKRRRCAAGRHHHRPASNYKTLHLSESSPGIFNRPKVTKMSVEMFLAN